MVTITPRAAEQIQISARQSQAVGLPLRIAAKRGADGAIEYGLGFEDQPREEDLTFHTEGVDLVIAPISIDLLTGTVLDFVELESGEQQFIFMNPQDPNYSRPEDEVAP